LELLQAFVDDFLTPFAGNPHFGLFLIVWFSAVFPLAPPEEAYTLLTGAAIAGGILHWFLGGFAVIAGIIATNITQYWMGRGVLKMFMGTRIGNRFVNSRKFRKARETMKQKGIWAIVGCRFFFGTRAPTYVATGFLRYRFWKFVAIDATTTVLHGMAGLILGYIFYQQIDGVLDFMKGLGIWSLVLLIALIAAIFGIKYLRRKKADVHDP
jgi:membrane protein DedA with SNARE-associated domain